MSGYTISENAVAFARGDAPERRTKLEAFCGDCATDARLACDCAE